ncbi:chaperonin 10-like protein [Cercophora newfieldiana]|uniref:Chaperonin 10-like protein n=1 Tax=Cercophora newfieldiana TaxID=92897 RepID=A0AA39YM55_9PEZI|nr:chaperonin 10-like protein [Cercophora newfieldiana]
MAKTVLASVLHGPRDLRLESRPLPSLSPTDVQLSILTTGLCGSDLHYYTHFRNGDILVREPLTLGHESSGLITALGSAVTSLSVGDRVALEVGQPCTECDLCASGRYNICRGMKFRSSAKAFPHAQGTLQEEVVMPARWVHKLPAEVSSEMGALAEPLAVALHAAARGGLGEGGKVLVFGAGAVGLLCAAVSKAVTRARVVVVADIQEDRVRFAVENGFADGGVVVPARRPETVEGKLEYAREVAEMVKGLVVNGEAVGEVGGTYECTGVESCMQSSIYATAPGGKIMIIGMGNPIQTLPISAASLREVDLIGVFRYANTYPRVIELLASKNPLLPDLTKLITQRFKGMDNIPKAFDMAAKVKDDEGNLVLKVVVDM